MAGETYYLSSLDSIRFEPVRECRLDRRLVFDSGKTAVLARLSPGVIGSDFRRPSDIESVILTPRFAGASIDPIDEFPCFVFIAVTPDGAEPRSPIGADDLQVIGWGELYRTRAHAESHTFD